MAKSHEGRVIELFSGLDHAEKTQLLELLNRLKRHLTSLDSGTP